MNLLEIVSNRLREIRKELHLNQTEMGGILGVSRASYSLYENAKLPIDIVMLDRLCKKTGYSADYLLGYTEYKRLGEPMDIDVIRGEAPPLKEDQYDINIPMDLLFASAGDLRRYIGAVIEKEFEKRGIDNGQKGE